MSDLREQAERMVAERCGFRIEFRNDPDTCSYVIPTTGRMYRHANENDAANVYELAVRLQVELLAEKQKDSRG